MLQNWSKLNHYNPVHVVPNRNFHQILNPYDASESENGDAIVGIHMSVFLRKRMMKQIYFNNH